MVNYRAGMTRDRRLPIPYSFGVVLINARLAKEEKIVQQLRFTLLDVFFVAVLILKERWKRSNLQ